MLIKLSLRHGLVACLGLVSIIGAPAFGAADNTIWQSANLVENVVSAQELSSDESKVDQEGNKTSSGAFRLAQVDQGKGAGASLVANQPANSQEASNSSSANLAEIIVTAQKRSERLMDVPASITAISGEQLESMQVRSLSDLASYVPGLTVSSDGSPGHRYVVIRGLISSYQGDGAGPLVGTYIDNIPVNASTNSARGTYIGLDLMPYDIDHVEVLEGPQGTLYGSNTMGGLIKYVLKKPDLSQFEARAGTSIEAVHGSSSPDWGVHGAVNLPLVTDKLAVRLSGFDQTTAGWIDNVGTGTSNANHSTVHGGRAAMLWQPTDHLSVQATVLFQDINSDDTTAVTLDPITRLPKYGSAVISTFFPQATVQHTRNYSVAVNWDLGIAALSSSSAWSTLKTNFNDDLTVPFGQYVGSVDPANANALANYEIRDQLSKFVEEVRLTSPENQQLQWMLGGYFTREYGGDEGTIATFTPSYVPLPPKDAVLINTGDIDVYKEKAVFGNMTLKVTDRFDITGGGRYSSFTTFNCPGFSGGIFGGNVTLPCSGLPDQGVWTWSGDARFHFNSDSMVYARVANGYRPGTGCPTCTNPLVPNAPRIVNPDTTVDYEIGFKGDLLDRRLQLTASIFDVEWKNIQTVALSSNNTEYSLNAGRARSDGLEAAFQYRVSADLRVSSTLTYTDARLTEVPAAVAVAVGGRSGDQLALAPRWTGTLAGDYQRPIRDGVTLIAGGNYRYRDMIVSQFPGQATGSFPIRPQNIVGVYTGVEIKQMALRLYGNNVFNDRSYAGLRYAYNPNAPQFVPIQPVTIGVSLDYKF